MALIQTCSSAVGLIIGAQLLRGPGPRVLPVPHPPGAGTLEKPAVWEVHQEEEEEEELDEQTRLYLSHDTPACGHTHTHADGGR